ncbi:hypothetical protein [Paraburkholderia caballeronis]|uniref:hypothetical protein n=1 Tax=Paraburkholderia caballeronis TaxID=416943 RepID=UPI001065356A|nr:hypothetical protein [Paraburkholderia caballeronis]
MARRRACGAVGSQWIRLTGDTRLASIVHSREPGPHFWSVLFWRCCVAYGCGWRFVERRRRNVLRIRFDPRERYVTATRYPKQALLYLHDSHLRFAAYLVFRRRLTIRNLVALRRAAFKTAFANGVNRASVTGYQGSLQRHSNARIKCGLRKR